MFTCIMFILRCVLQTERTQCFIAIPAFVWCIGATTGVLGSTLPQTNTHPSATFGRTSFSTHETSYRTLTTCSSLRNTSKRYDPMILRLLKVIFIYSFLLCMRINARWGRIKTRYRSANMIYMMLSSVNPGRLTQVGDVVSSQQVSPHAHRHLGSPCITWLPVESAREVTCTVSGNVSYTY